MKRQVLVVDDDNTTRTLLSALLRSNGYDVRQAADGEQAINECTGEVPDLVLLDLFMPGMNGHEVAAHLKSKAESKATPIIMLTSSDDQAEIERAHENGASDYVVKPFEAGELLSKIKRALDTAA
jgi:CheY-like chemotaxis protein